MMHFHMLDVQNHCFAIALCLFSIHIMDIFPRPRNGRKPCSSPSWTTTPIGPCGFMWFLTFFMPRHLCFDMTFTFMLHRFCSRRHTHLPFFYIFVYFWGWGGCGGVGGGGGVVGGITFLSRASLFLLTRSWTVRHARDATLLTGSWNFRCARDATRLRGSWNCRHAHASNRFLELQTRSWCYASKRFLELQTRSWCYASSMFLELQTRSWCYASNMFWCASI